MERPCLFRISLRRCGEDSGRNEMCKTFSTVLKLDSVGLIPYKIQVSDKANHVVNVASEIQRVARDQAVDIENPVNNSETGSVSLSLKFRAWFDIASYSIASNMVDIVNGQIPENKIAGDVISEDIPIVIGYNQFNYH